MCCCARNAWPAAGGRGLPGSIINVTSIEGVRAAPGYAAYAAAKAGVINYTKTAALELAPHDIRVNALAPDLTADRRPATGCHRAVCRRNAAVTDSDGSPGHVDEMAGAAVFLASDMSRYITGQTIHVDGGTQAAQRLVPQPADRRLSTGPRLVQCAQPSAA